MTSRLVPVRRVDEDDVAETTDRVTVEAALELRLHGEPFAIVMRTPGADRELTAGFLFTEGILRSKADLSRIDLLTGNVADVRLTDARARQLPSYIANRRQVTTSASCGMCGRRSLDDLEIDAPALDAAWTVTPEVIVSLPERLRAVQATFDETGGLHAAALVQPDGTIGASAEDVGRHNAVDKLLGRALLADGLPLARQMLFVSGRTSFEIVQKAFLGGVPIVAAVSAPSSLAVELAETAGITLVGFVRGGRFNVYSHASRVTAPVKAGAPK